MRGRAEPIGRELVRRLLPRRDPEGHKGTFGKVLCLCGSVGLYRSAGICQPWGGAFRGGTGVSGGAGEYLAGGGGEKRRGHALSPAGGGGTAVPAGGGDDPAACGGCDAVLLGCGLGRGRQTDALVRRLMDLPQRWCWMPTA